MRSLPVVETRGLSVYLGGELVLKDINTEIAAGEMVGVIGPNGAGKTTFLRVLLGLVKPAAGEVKIFGHSPDTLGKIRDKIGYMPQRLLHDRHFPLSVRDVVMMGMVSSTTLGRSFSRLQQEKARQCLEKVGLLELQDKLFAELSGGQQQRVFLARALSKKPDLLLLDEPNAGLDLPAQNRFFALLQELQQALGLTVVMVSHDLTLIARHAQKLICINRTMHIHGTPVEVLNSPCLEKAYRCEFDLLFGGRERRV
ncbi:MAG: metal ABC transporter ATP-binding protein [Dethiobacteria bacterium]|jgi:ABC-type Mn2+/Zn2+ transport system ATPase subunit